MMSDGDLLACLTVIHLLYVSHTTPPYLPPSFPPSLPPLTLIATHCAPRSPKSSTNTAYNGILLKKGLTRPLSRKAAINKLSFPAIRSMFLGVNPPVINNPPNGIHLSPATPASDP